MPNADALSPLTALSPLDGRYRTKVAALAEYFSEFGLIRERIRVELAWLEALGLAHLCVRANGEAVDRFH